MEATPVLRMSSHTLVRSLTPADLEAVVALDRKIVSGSPRRGYFDKRLAAALQFPERHIQLAVATDGKLVGFLLARIAGGEFGRPEKAGVIESVAVEPDIRGKGLGRRMVHGLEERLATRGIKTLVTQVDWHNGAMLEFLSGAKFSLAPRQILQRAVHRMPLPETDEEIEKVPPIVRHLRADDLEAVSRIDRMIVGQDRTEYLKRKFEEVLHESAIEVSLVAEDDGFVVAFAMARVDLGDFGHVEPTASLDTIGVNPGFAQRGFARAVLTQMVDNLSALYVERLETEVANNGFDLLRFLYRFGFGPSQRLVFERRF